MSCHRTDPPRACWSRWPQSGRTLEATTAVGTCLAPGSGKTGARHEPRVRPLRLMTGGLSAEHAYRGLSSEDRGTTVAKIKLGKIHAILGRSHRTGRWRLSPRTSVVALLGSCRLDLREAQLDGDVSKMTATVFLGGVTIIIPPGVEVRPSGLSLLGGATVDVPSFEDGQDAALIEIEWTSVFGRLRIGDNFDPEEPEEDEADAQVDKVAAPAVEPTANPAPAVEPKPAPKPPPAIGFEDLDEPEPAPKPAPAVGFEDLDEPEPAPKPAPAVGFEDLDEPEPTPAVGFEDLDEPTPAPQPAPAVGFEDLDEPTPTPEPTPAVGFEDLDEPTPAPQPAPAVGFEDLDDQNPHQPSDSKTSTNQNPHQPSDSKTSTNPHQNPHQPSDSKTSTNPRCRTDARTTRPTTPRRATPRQARPTRRRPNLRLPSDSRICSRSVDSHSIPTAPVPIVKGRVHGPPAFEKGNSL